MFKSISKLFGGSPKAERIAVIDVGSNSVRMVVFLAETRIPAVLFNEKALCGLGEDLETTGRLSAEGRVRAISSLRRFRSLAERLNVDATMAIGTAALRDAEDGAEFVAEAAELGVDIEIIEGRDEARLAAQGVILGDQNAKGVVADLGGASLELVRVDARAEPQVSEGSTTPLGALRLMSRLESYGRSKTAGYIDDVLSDAFSTPNLYAEKNKDTLYVLGGSFRTFASAWMQLKDYPLRVLHGYSMEYDEALEAAEWLSRLTPQQVKEVSGASDRRAQVTPPACLALLRLIKRVRPKQLSVSAFGLREGAYWEHLAQTVRSADPLLNAAARIEKLMSRSPGFGQDLFEWLQPIMVDFSDEERRLAEAACLLSDASWRTHPDYRAMASFELMTRNSFGGIDHPGRAFVGAALLHRHKGGARAARMEAALKLASEESVARAAALGRGMRLGATIGAAMAGVLPDLPIAKTDKMLELRFSGSGKAVASEVVKKRLDAMAKSMNLEARLISP